LRAGRLELLQLVEHFGHALAAELVQASEQNPAKTALVGIEKELRELRPFCAAPTCLVTILRLDGVAQPRGKSL
jgi:hypothetical protein